MKAHGVRAVCSGVMICSLLRQKRAAGPLVVFVVCLVAHLHAEEPRKKPTVIVGTEGLLAPAESDLEAQRKKLEGIRAKDGEGSATYLEHRFDEVGLLAALGRLPEAEKLLAELEAKASAMQAAASTDRTSVMLLRSSMLNARLHVLEKQGRHEEFNRTCEERLACIAESTDPEMKLVALDVMAGAVLSQMVLMDHPREAYDWLVRLTRRLDEPGCQVGGRNAKPLLNASQLANHIGCKPEAVRLAEAARQAAVNGGSDHAQTLFQCLTHLVEIMPDARGLPYLKELKEQLARQAKEAGSDPERLKQVVRGFAAVASGCVTAHLAKNDPALLQEARQAYEDSHRYAMRWLPEEDASERAIYTCKRDLDLAALAIIRKIGAREIAALEKAIAAAESKMDTDDTRLNAYRNMLIVIYQDENKHERALKLLGEMLNHSTRALGEKHPVTATVHHQMGRSLASLGRSEEAVKEFEKAAALREAALGARHPEVARSYYNLGAMREAAQDYAGAQAYYEHVLGIDKEAFGADSTEVRHDAVSIVRMLGMQNKITEAEEIIRQQIALLKNRDDSHSLARADLRQMLAPILSERGHLTRAKELLEVNIQELNSKNPELWPLLAASHMRLAELNHQMNRIEVTAAHLKMQITYLWSVQHSKGGCEGWIAKATNDYKDVLLALRHDPAEIHKLLKSLERGVAR